MKKQLTQFVRHLAVTLSRTAGPIKTVTQLPLQDFILRGIHGNEVRGSDWVGHPILFVNVASKCGFTPQYDGLQALYTKYRDAGLIIVGVPCNQFLSQEPGGAEEIESFCRRNYGVEFPLLEKQDVNGPERSELYQYLIGSSSEPDEDIKWNFEKILVAKDGQVIARFSSKVTPNDPQLLDAVRQALESL